MKPEWPRYTPLTADEAAARDRMFAKLEEALAEQERAAERQRRWGGFFQRDAKHERDLNARVKVRAEKRAKRNAAKAARRRNRGNR